jgi:hypothetical protein
MAKKKSKAIRRKVSGSSKQKSRGFKSSSSSTPMKKMLFGVMYGAGRSYASQLITPITSRIPFLGNYADEAGMLALSYFAAKGTFGATFKEVGTAGLYIESALVGKDIVTGQFMSNLSLSGSSSNNVRIIQ